MANSNRCQLKVERWAQEKERSWIKVVSGLESREKVQSQANQTLSHQENRIVIFLGGKVMTGRGIDQIWPHPSEPFIPEFELRDAREATQELLIKRYVGNLTSEEQLPTMKIGVAVASWRKGLWPPQI